MSKNTKNIVSPEEFKRDYAAVPIKTYEIFTKPFRDKIERLENERILALRARARV